MDETRERAILSNYDMVNHSHIWRLVRDLGEDLQDAYEYDLARPYKRVESVTLLNMAWLRLSKLIEHKEPGTEMFWDLPEEIRMSQTCIAQILIHPPLLEMIHAGKISYYGIVKFAKEKGTWI